jgi:hypothetical protein
MAERLVKMKKREGMKILPKDQISPEVWDRIVSQLENRLNGQNKAIEAPKKEGFVRFLKYKTYFNAIKNLFNKKGG